jgi:transcriptional regulator of acetoin/glycerol metabolism
MKTDVIWRTLELAMQSCPSLSSETARAVETAARAEFAGTRVWIAEQPFHPERSAGRKSVSREAAAALYQDALTNTSTADLVKKHGLSRATIYRLMKRGPSD